MATHGELSAFNPTKEQWTSYIERAHYYFIANDVKSDEKKCAILFSGCGPETYQTIRSIVDAETLQKSKFENLVEIISAHYDPKPSFIVQRFKFYNRVRAPGESIAAFVASLRKIAEHCEYNDTLKDMLRDRLVCGVNHEGIQRKLLAEKTLTYDKALEIVLTMETAEQGTKDLKAWDKPNKPEDLHYTSHKPRQQWTAGNPETKPSSTPKCYRCLGKHLASSCKHRTTECLFCKKIGHIAKACRSKKDQEKKLVGTLQRTKKTHHLEETEEESEKRDSSYHLFTLESNPITVQVELNQVSTKMEVDTGSSLSLINKSTYDLIASKSHIQILQKSKVKLKTYTGE